MTFTSNIPQSGETLGSTRARVNTNFQQLAVVEAINHVAFNDADQGKHKFLQMPEQAAAPTTAANEGGFYTKDSGGTNLFYRSESLGSEYKITAVDDAFIARFGTNTLYDPVPQNQNGGWTFLPGGLLLMYGTALMASGSGIVRFPKSFSAAPYSIQLTMQKPGDSIDVFMIRDAISAPTATEMRVRNTDSNTRLLNWMAIGPA